MINRTRPVLFVSFSLLLVNPLGAQRAMSLDSLSSPSLGSTRTFGLLLPARIEPGRQYPLLYLLHGHDRSYRDWYGRTDLKEYVDDLDMIVVLPDADNSWYVNSNADPEKRYEDYLMTDLFAHIERLSPVDPKRRAIAGLSMGGYGALLYAVKYPGRFAFAASFSGV